MTHRGARGKLLSPRGRQGLGVVLEQVSLCQEATQLCSFIKRLLQAWPPMRCSPWRFQAACLCCDIIYVLHHCTLKCNGLFIGLPPQQPVSNWRPGRLVCLSILEPATGPATEEYQITVCRMNGEKV